MPDIAGLGAEIAQTSAPLPRFMAVSSVVEPAGWRLARHSHGHYEMLLFETGRHVVTLDGGERESEPGDVLLFSPGMAHGEFSPVKSEWLVLSFAWPGGASPGACGRDPLGRMRTLARWMLHEGESLSPGRDALREQFLQALLAEFRDSFRPRTDPMVERVRALVRSDLSRPTTLDELARAGGYSRFAFVREYRRRAGTTPAADMRRMRLEKARELLLQTDLPPKAVAARVGLGDAHALGRLFRKHFGHAPGALRRRDGKNRGKFNDD